ncbi:hypothetical protein N1851_021438 [Merluccius polli]|uniref:Myb/SANT-like DNA-binding domain-containing protein n=1 Tax=Merluccius polli TaxID=89951 RepID=A0AA47MJG4_MERPO|nr:hypothetical protein N1851_021438 [Merluccius polli]
MKTDPRERSNSVDIKYLDLFEEEYLSDDPDLQEAISRSLDSSASESDLQMTLERIMEQISSRVNNDSTVRFNIIRRSVWGGASRALGRSNFSPEKKVDVKFTDDYGISEGAMDNGGPTQEFIMDTSMLARLWQCQLLMGDRVHVSCLNSCMSVFKKVPDNVKVKTEHITDEETRSQCSHNTAKQETALDLTHWYVLQRTHAPFERKRSTYFNTLELEVLMLAYADYEHIFRRKSNTAAAAKEREAAWEKIAARVNACNSKGEKRTWQQLKMKHKNIIQNANRKKAEARKTGGGPPKPPLTEAEELALSQNRGIPGGSSSEPVTPQDTSAYIRCNDLQMTLERIMEQISSRVNNDSTVRFNIIRRSVWGGASRALGRSNFSPEKKVDVKFTDDYGISEGAVDNGGPTQEYFRLCLHEIKDKIGIFEVMKDNGYFNAGQIMAIVHVSCLNSCMSVFKKVPDNVKVKTEHITDEETRSQVQSVSTFSFDFIEFINKLFILHALIKMQVKQSYKLRLNHKLDQSCRSQCSHNTAKQETALDLTHWYVLQRTHAPFERSKESFASAAAMLDPYEQTTSFRLSNSTCHRLSVPPRSVIGYPPLANSCERNRS